MRLSKHHGIGNDFLVLLDGEGSGDLARRLCDRRMGIGADGLLLATRPDGESDADAHMVLWNADGSRAEMSGNGVRCLAQALVDEGWVGEGHVRIDTDAGIKRIEVGPEIEPGLREVSADMGPAEVEELGDVSARISMGNPHTVLHVDDLAEFGHQDASRNIEFIVPGPEDDAITMRVVERGVGETLACGTGACAAARAANLWGLVGDIVTVHQPGGDAVVELRPDTIVLRGPVRRVARIEVDA